ncbi:MAG: hypothetical protein AB7K09_21855 [Planctomycetota bacterium]
MVGTRMRGYMADQFADRNEVIARFRSRAYLRCGVGQSIARFMIVPSFDSLISMDVFRHAPTYKGETSCFHTVWRGHSCIPSPGHEVPSPDDVTVTRIAPSRTRTIVSVVNRLRRVRLPVLPPMASGLDGMDYELFLSAGFGSTTLKFWVHVPYEWRKLVRPLRKLLRLFGEPEHAAMIGVPDRSHRRRFPGS